MKRKSEKIDPNILFNEFIDLESETYYSSITENMVESEKITSIDLSNNERFSDVTDTTELFEYIQKHESRYTPYIDTLKSGVVRIKDSMIANDLFEDLVKEFNNSFDTVDIFSSILDYFGFNGSEYMNRLVLPNRLKLIKDLSNRVDIGFKF